MQSLKQATKQNVPWIYNLIREVKFLLNSKFWGSYDFRLIDSTLIAETEGERFFSQELNGSIQTDKYEFLTGSVRAVTIDGLAREFGSPNVLFLDVEGHEIP